MKFKMSIPKKNVLLIPVIFCYFFGGVIELGSEPLKNGEKSLIVGKNVVNRWVNFVDSAEKSIYIATYKLTSKTALKALINAKKRGVKVRLILDGEAAQSSKSLAGKAGEAGIEVLTWKSDKNGKLHTKLYIIDETKAMFGSFNLTKSAETENYELFYICDEKAVVKEAMEAWESILKIARNSGNDQ